MRWVPGPGTFSSSHRRSWPHSEGGSIPDRGSGTSHSVANSVHIRQRTWTSAEGGPPKQSSCRACSPESVRSRSPRGAVRCRSLQALNLGAAPLRTHGHLSASFQALPYVCLLIAMLFFIYAIIGMQVSRCPRGPVGGSRRPGCLWLASLNRQDWGSFKEPLLAPLGARPRSCCGVTLGLSHVPDSPFWPPRCSGWSGLGAIGPRC